MLKSLSLVLVCTLLVSAARAQRDYADFTAMVEKLQTTKGSDLDRLWAQLVSEDKIPLTAEDSVAFLYRGEAAMVTWVGDFNAWGYDKQFPNKGRRISGTDLWILKASLPAQARVDYKILVNKKQWVIDPANRATQWSGVGGGSINSELRMPDWQKDSLTSSRLSKSQGTVAKDILLDSKALGYQITYSIYFPPDFQKEKAYPLLYVTDGYEYMHERMGNMITILDNLIYLSKIPPVIAIFIDHREPANRSANRRMTELAMNAEYARFVIGELMPTVEKDLVVAKYPYSRAIIGNSAGGLFSTWIAFSRPDLFPLAGIESPSFSFQPAIYAFCQSAEKTPERIFMSSGLIHDNGDGARRMREIFEEKSCPYRFVEVNQGHSWGNWRDLSDDLLVYLLATE